MKLIGLLVLGVAVAEGYYLPEGGDEERGIVKLLMDEKDRILMALNLTAKPVQGNRQKRSISFHSGTSATKKVRRSDQKEQSEIERNENKRTGSSNLESCCKRKMTILDFTELSWDFILAPKKIRYWYCSNVCAKGASIGGSKKCLPSERNIFQMIVGVTEKKEVVVRAAPLVSKCAFLPQSDLKSSNDGSI